MPFLLRLAWQDLRSSGRSLWVFCACLFLGVLLVCATAGLYRITSQGLLAETRALLGGDVEVDAETPLPDEAVAWMRERGDVSLVVELDTMLGTEAGDFLRVELQAMDTEYPLYGNLVLEPAGPLAEATRFADGHWGVAIDPVLASNLDLAPGDTVYVGSLAMRVRALVLNQPDRALSAEWRGAPVLLSESALAESGLVQAGSLLDYNYRVRTDVPVRAWREEFYAAFPDQPWDVRTFENRSRRIAERLGQLASGLLVIGFSTLFIGGLGIFNSVQAYLRGRLKTIAILRSVGLRNRRLAAVYLLQVGIMAAAASLCGALAGGVLALVAANTVAAELPISVHAGSLAAPLATGFGFGIVTAYAFALPALGKALATEPAGLFRGSAHQAASAPRSWRLATLACALGIAALVLAALPDYRFGLGFVAIVGALLLLLELLVRAIRSGARRLDRSEVLAWNFSLRLALANLHRPGAPLRATLLSLGSSLTLVVACTMVVVSLVRTIRTTIPRDAPALVLYDIMDAQRNAVVEEIRRTAADARVETTPLVRATLVAINGIELAEVPHLGERQRRDASRELFDLSYSGNNIDGVTVSEGRWWADAAHATPRLALEDREAEQLGLNAGDRVTFGIAGQTLDVEIDVIFSQQGLQTRFWFEGIVSNGALDEFVHRHVGTAYLDDAEAIVAQRNIGNVAPNVITVRTASLLASARDILGKALTALSVIAVVSLLASLLVVTSVLAAGQSRQLYDATVLHSLGTRLSLIRRSLHVEYLLLAGVTTAFAVLLGGAIALPLLALRLKLPTESLFGPGAAIAATVSTVALLAAARYFLRRLRPQPAFLLRDAG